ncbi:MAG: alpha-L-rhamnosidase C-terminal domain-containing protein [Cytophagaceae bacterium]
MNNNNTLKKLFFLLFLAGIGLNAQSQALTVDIQNDILQKQWTAQWISVPNELSKSQGIYHFRKTIVLSENPGSFIVHVSGDNRYKLFVNGELVCLGPARGDITHWNFETLDIGKYLKAGSNLLAAVVWNYGSYSPESQISYRSGFILQGNSAKERIADTGPFWKCLRNKGYEFVKPDLGYSTYYVACPGESLNGADYPWNWEKADFDDKTWLNAQPIMNGLPKGVASWDAGWELVPRTIPAMEMKPEKSLSVRKSEGIKIPADFFQKPATLVIPAKTSVKIILDQSYITTAYPVLKFHGGKNARVQLRYAESLYNKENFSADRNNLKGNRNEVEGKLFMGYKDEILSDGGSHTFVPLWFRTYRYLELSISSAEEALSIDELSGIFTAYPFEARSAISLSDPGFNKILDTGWRTFRLCARETYIDCPYYEQLMYIGDTRIESMITLYNTEDDRLVRDAIRKFESSRTSEGITWCRWPANDPQFIPPFSLWWINMVHDYWMYRGDSAFIRSMLPGTRSILAFFEERQNNEGLTEKIPYWNFMDWVKGWQYGIAPADAMGHSAPIDLQLLIALQAAEQLESDLGNKHIAWKYDLKIKQLQESIKKNYWDAGSNYFADTPDKKNFSQHSNTLAVIAGLVKGPEAKELMGRVLSDTTLSPCSLYFSYYLNYAATMAGLGDQYLDLLFPWKEQLSRGMSTWAESPEPARSDCHAWGSSPNVEAYRTILGISSDAGAFHIVKISPNLGKLKIASGSMPHPQGKISVSYKFNKAGKLEADITLPPGTTGVFHWKETKTDLHPGQQLLTL